MLTKFAYFIPIKSTFSALDYARIFIDKIVCRHGIPLSIISDRGAQFTSRFWRSFQKRLGTKVKLSTTFHPQTDGKAECIINKFEYMLRGCIINFKGNLDKQTPLVEFSYKNSYRLCIYMDFLRPYMV